MIQATGTKLMGQTMDKAASDRTTTPNKGKKSLIDYLAAITEVFGDDRGLLKFLITMNDEEIAAIQKFAQGYMDGDFAIDVVVDHGTTEKSGIFP